MHFLDPRTRTTSTLDDVHRAIATRTPQVSTVWFGEYHQHHTILAGQLALLRALSPRAIVFEHFNFHHQHDVLDAFARGEIDLDEAQRRYEVLGREGFDIRGHYGALMVEARAVGCRLVAGFVPREYAARVARCVIDGVQSNVLDNVQRQPGESIDVFDSTQAQLGHAATSEDSLQAIFHDLRTVEGWPGLVDTFQRLPAIAGNQPHYRYFRALMGGAADTPKMRAIFRAQLLKDASLAWAVEQELCNAERHYTGTLSPYVYVVCGSGHCDFGFGAPAQLLSEGYGRGFLLTARYQEDVPDGAPSELDDASGDYDSPCEPPFEEVADRVLVVAEM